jgi:hypothetical protein
MTSRTGGSAGLPKDSAQRSTPFAWIICSAIMLSSSSQSRRLRADLA